MPGTGKTARSGRIRLTAAQRRDLILQSATEVFSAVGYRAGKASDIAARAGVTEPVVFQNFGSKAALYAAVLDRLTGSIRAELPALIHDHGSAGDLLAHILAPAPPREAHGHTHRLLFTDAATLAADPTAGEPARHAARTLAGHLAGLLRRAQADGSISARTDPETAAWLALSILSTRPMRATSMPDPDHLEPGVTALTLQAITG
jgi:AcrR family transcriptional regulator